MAAQTTLHIQFCVSYVGWGSAVYHFAWVVLMPMTRPGKSTVPHSVVYIHRFNTYDYIQFYFLQNLSVFTSNIWKRYFMDNTYRIHGNVLNKYRQNSFLPFVCCFNRIYSTLLNLYNILSYWKVIYSVFLQKYKIP